MRSTSSSILKTRRFSSPHPNRRGRVILYQMALFPLSRSGGCFGTRRVILSGEGDSAHPHKPLQAQRRHLHPPRTFPPSCGDRFFLPPKSRKRPGSFEIYAHRAHSDKTYPRTVVGSDATEGLVTSIRSPASSRCRICAIELRKRFIFDSE